MKVYKTLFSLALSLSLNASQTTLKPITVTAQKSEENSQKVPLSLSVFDGVSLEDKQIDTLDDLDKYVPNLLLFQTGQQGLTPVSMRGISANVLTFSTPVSLYIDGVPTMNSFGYFSVLDDMERIEILKGPQGTLYGKNSQAGVINIISKKPNNNFNAKISTTIGTDGKRGFDANILTPILKDKVYLGLYFNHAQKDGFIKNRLTNRYVNDKKYNHAKLNLRFTPTDSLEISLIALALKLDNGAHDWSRSKNKVVSSNVDSYSKPITHSYSLQVKYDIDDRSKLSSVSTYRYNKDRALVDADMMPKTLRHIDKNNKYNAYTQEFKYEYNFSPLKLVSGLYFDKTKDTLFTKIITPMDLRGKRAKHQRLSSDSIGVYTSVTYAVTDNLSSTFGLRYDKENKNLKVEKTNIYLKDSWENFSPKIGLSYDINPNSMIYASVAKGYRSGGFNPYAPKAYKTYDEESLISYEIGTKNSFLSDTLKFNFNIYYMDIDNTQIEQMQQVSTLYVANAATATSKGFESEMSAILTDEISFYGTFGLNLSKFKSFAENLVDYKGNYLPNAPKYNYSTGFIYRNNAGFYSSIGLSGYGKTYFDKANKISQNPYELVNAKIGYERDCFDIYLYANNLFDKNHDAINAYFNGTTSILKDGREIGIKFTYRF